MLRIFALVTIMLFQATAFAEASSSGLIFSILGDLTVSAQNYNSKLAVIKTGATSTSPDVKQAIGLNFHYATNSGGSVDLAMGYALSFIILEIEWKYMQMTYSDNAIAPVVTYDANGKIVSSMYNLQDTFNGFLFNAYATYDNNVNMILYLGLGLGQLNIDSQLSFGQSQTLFTSSADQTAGQCMIGAKIALTDHLALDFRGSYLKTNNYSLMNIQAPTTSTASISTIFVPNQSKSYDLIGLKNATFSFGVGLTIFM